MQGFTVHFENTEGFACSSGPYPSRDLATEALLKLLDRVDVTHAKLSYEPSAQEQKITDMVKGRAPSGVRTVNVS